MNLSNTLLIVSFFANIVLVFLLFLRSRKKRNNLAALFILSVALWILSIYFLKNFQTTFFAELPFAIGSLVPVALLLFVLNFKENYDSKRELFLIVPSVALMAISFVKGAIFKDFRVEQNSIVTSGFNYGYFLFIVYFVVYSLTAVTVLIKSFLTAKGIARVQLKFLLYGLIVSLCLITLSSLVLPLLNIYILNSIGPAFSLIMTGFFSYSITKHYLLEIKVLFSEIWAVLLVFVTLVWTLMNFNFFNVILSILVVGISGLFIKSVLSESNKNEKLERLNHQLERDKHELVELDRMKDEFLQMATHELNTPITVIQGKLDMAIRENMCELNEKQKSFFEPVLNDTKRLASLSKDILNTARIDQHRFVLNYKETNVDEFLSQIVESFQDKGRERGNEIIYRPLRRDLPGFAFDQSKINEVVTNLISNANKFTEHGKVIVTPEIKDDKLLVTVEDEGIGIEKEYQKHLFEKFYQAGRFDPLSPKEQQGSGLGLYISKNIIHLHGGEIWCESDKGKGSRFSFTLPLSRKQTQTVSADLKSVANKVNV